MTNFYPDLGKYFEKEFGVSENRTIIFTSTFTLFSITFNCFENAGTMAIMHNNHFGSIDFLNNQIDSVVALALEYNLIDNHKYLNIINGDLVNIQTLDQSFIYYNICMKLRLGKSTFSLQTKEKFIPLVLESIKISHL